MTEGTSSEAKAASGRTTGDTRARIQQIALELFTEQGYEQTALREIAERLGVTKAALYYHFKSKDEIVNSFVDDRIARLDELLAWADTQEPGPAYRREFLRRYADVLHDEEHQSLMRFFEQNQPALKAMPAGARLREQMQRLWQALTGPKPDPADRLRAAVACLAVHASWVALRDLGLSADEQHDASLAVAIEVADRITRAGS